MSEYRGGILICFDTLIWNVDLAMDSQRKYFWWTIKYYDSY